MNSGNKIKSNTELSSHKTQTHCLASASTADTGADSLVLHGEHFKGSTGAD